MAFKSLLSCRISVIIHRATPALVLTLSLLQTTSILAIVLPSTSHATLEEYPYFDPYLATVTKALMKASPAARFAEVSIAPLPGRNQVPILEKRTVLTGLLLKQDHPAPLIFVIPGLGGNSREGGLLQIAESLHRRGFSVLTVPSTFNWQFVLAQSTTAIPGFGPEDAKDLRRVMYDLKSTAERSYGLRVTRTAAVGYSFGAATVAFVMMLEREQPMLGLERVVMINPPISMKHAIRDVL